MTHLSARCAFIPTVTQPVKRMPASHPRPTPECQFSQAPSGGHKIL